MRITLLTLTMLLSGCAGFGFPGNPGNQDCYVTVEKPAPMFYVGFTSPATANATISLEPWVYLSAALAKPDELIPESFRAEVDAGAKTVTVSGKIRRFEANPAANCAFPAIALIPTGSTLSIPVILPAGTYSIRIATDSFTWERPPSDQPNQNVDYPAPEPVRTLVVQ